MSQYIYRGTRRLRCGYTTGSCAAAASKASAEMLLSQTPVQSVTLMTPAGIELTTDVMHSEIHSDYASSAIQKDSGDDPDITNGILIYAKVSLKKNGIEIVGGKGIGTVTKPGLNQPVGSSAINDTPRQMIAAAVSEIAELHGYSGGFLVEISAPEGIEIAKKTFNPRMGILGGISIIGTTGIVEPMSNQAIIETIRAEASMRAAAGYKNLLLTVGNYSDRFLKMNLPNLTERCVMCSNFIGDALDIGVSLNFERILLIGHIGKLVKLGSGIMNTHSSFADGRMETLIACGALAGVPSEILKQLTDCITTDAALEVLYHHHAAEPTLTVLTDRIEQYMQLRVRGAIQIGAVIFSDRHDLLLKTTKADEILQHITEEKL